jgi:dCMP deaminase
MRPSKEEYFMSMANLVASRATCVRRAVGCVLVNKDGHVLATGYNGVPRGMPHCIDGDHCPGSRESSGQGLDQCLAVHAEQNALLQCRDVREIDTAYVTTSPCIHCLKLLMNTSCRVIVYREAYKGSVFNNTEASVLWNQSGWMRQAGVDYLNREMREYLPTPGGARG